MTQEEIRAEFESLSIVTDGAPEGCNFVTIWNGDMSNCHIVDLKSLSLLSNQSITAIVAAIREQLGVP